MVRATAGPARQSRRTACTAGGPRPTRHRCARCRGQLGLGPKVAGLGRPAFCPQGLRPWATPSPMARRLCPSPNPFQAECSVAPADMANAPTSRLGPGLWPTADGGHTADLASPVAKPVVSRPRRIPLASAAERRTAKFAKPTMAGVAGQPGPSGAGPPAASRLAFATPKSHGLASRSGSACLGTELVQRPIASARALTGQQPRANRTWPLAFGQHRTNTQRPVRCQLGRPATELVAQRLAHGHPKRCSAARPVATDAKRRHHPQGPHSAQPRRLAHPN